MTRKEEIIQEVDKFIADPVYSKLMNRNAAIVLAKHFVEWADKTTIDKAYEWLANYMDCCHIPHEDGGFKDIDSDAVMEYFRKAMEDEL